ncbi:MAG TPA: FN3 associated domain-containing protein, partial [Pirellulales bacterium]
MVGGNTSIYLRIPFTAQAGANYASLKLRMKYDDGFVAYLNGMEVARRNAGGTAGTPLAYNASGTDHPDAQATVFEDIDISAFKNLLLAGNNVLSIQGLNSSNTSTDLLILPELDATTVVSQTVGFMNPATPGAINGTASLGFLAEPVMSVTHGFFNAAFPVTISDATLGVTIRYTTDDSTPTETNGTLYTGPITISGTVDLRAAAFKTGYTTSDIETETYIFLSDILTQSTSTPPGFASTGTNGQVLNYGMDPTIVNSPVWGPQMLAALQSIPSISIVTDQANLWDPATGIYVNALNDGQDWERPASVELINPDGTTGFQINAGLRIRGGYSRNDYDPKHAFRLFFNDDYDGELVYPLFGDEGVDTFKKIDLRTDQNYSWSGEGDSRMTFLRDTFSRDTLRDLGQPYTRGRDYFLYLNGQFWGIYQTEERPDADYAESYFGGDDDNYDVVKANADNSAYNLTATDGNTDAFLQMWTLANQVAAAPTQAQRYDIFMQMQGLNPDGTRNTSYPVLLD